MANHKYQLTPAAEAAQRKWPLPPDLRQRLGEYFAYIRPRARQAMAPLRRRALARGLAAFLAACAEDPEPLEAWCYALDEVWDHLLTDKEATVQDVASTSYQQIAHLFRQPPSLSKWLWEPFAHRDSLVLTPSDMTRHVRDAQALLRVARRLPILPHGDVTFCFPDVDKRKHEWDQMPTGYSAALVLGRIGLYPPVVVKALDDPPYWINFVCNVRRRKREYRQIRTEREEPHLHERTGNDKVTPATHRTDYAVIRRYTIDVEQRHVPVLQISGISSAGTYIGALWATQPDLPRLPRAVDPTDPELRFEALVKGTCNAAANVWQLESDIACPHVYCGDYSWNGLDWDPLPPFVPVPHKMTIVKDDGAVVDLLADGRSVPLKPKSILYTMLLTMCERTHSHIHDCSHCGPLGHVSRDCDDAWQSTGALKQIGKRPADRYGELRKVVGAALQARHSQWRLVGIAIEEKSA